jgi:hypothetical protein
MNIMKTSNWLCGIALIALPAAQILAESSGVETLRNVKVVVVERTWTRVAF